MSKVKKSAMILFPILLAIYFFYPAAQNTSKKEELAIRFENKIEQTSSQNRSEIEDRANKFAEKKALLDSEYEKVLKVVESFNKTYDNILAVWNSYRVEMYRQIGVYEDLKDLDVVLDRHLKVIREIQVVSNQFEEGSEERKTLLELHKKAFQQMDEDVRLFVGDERFNYMKKARTHFNEAYRAHSHISAEILGW